MDGTADMSELLGDFGQTFSAMILTLIIASLIRSWRHSGKARAYAASSAVAFTLLLVQLYFTPFGYGTTGLLVIIGLGTWIASLIMTKGWYLLLEIALTPVLNILFNLVTG